MERECTGTYTKDTHASVWVPRYVALHRDLNFTLVLAEFSSPLPVFLWSPAISEIRQILGVLEAVSYTEACRGNAEPHISTTSMLV
jgi:hypothetical protein